MESRTCSWDRTAAGSPRRARRSPTASLPVRTRMCCTCTCTCTCQLGRADAHSQRFRWHSGCSSITRNRSVRGSRASYPPSSHRRTLSCGTSMSRRDPLSSRELAIDGRRGEIAKKKMSNAEDLQRASLKLHCTDCKSTVLSLLLWFTASSVRAEPTANPLPLPQRHPVKIRISTPRRTERDTAIPVSLAAAWRRRR